MILLFKNVKSMRGLQTRLHFWTKNVLGDKSPKRSTNTGQFMALFMAQNWIVHFFGYKEEHNCDKYIF